MVSQSRGGLYLQFLEQRLSQARTPQLMSSSLKLFFPTLESPLSRKKNPLFKMGVGIGRRGRSPQAARWEIAEERSLAPRAVWPTP